MRGLSLHRFLGVELGRCFLGLDRSVEVFRKLNVKVFTLSGKSLVYAIIKITYNLAIILQRLGIDKDMKK